MTDVFISFTCRGGIGPDWIVSLSRHLKSIYLANYGRSDLTVWEMSKNGPGVNFDQEISNVLKHTLLIILVLDPSYTNSVQAVDEIDKYSKARQLAGEPLLVIKIIKKRGDKDEILRSLVDHNLLVSYFSKIKPNGIEEEFAEGSPEYLDEVEKIVREIRRHKLQHRRKVTATKLLERLDQLKEVPKIYVAFGDANLTDGRLKFINQLNETIKHCPNERIRKVKVIPDDFTLTQFDHEALSELLCEENEYRQDCLDKMLDQSHVVIVPFESDNKAEAEQFLKRIRYQLKDIKLKAQDLQKKLPVHILLNVPDVLYQTEDFKNELDNPGYSGYDNIKLVRNQIITSYIESFVEDLTTILDPPVDHSSSATTTEASKIYIIEDNNAPKGEVAADTLQEEECNRANLREYLAGRFMLIPKLDPEENLSLGEAILRLKDWLSISDGIIIYRGIREDDRWCMRQQTETYKAILELKRERLKNDLARAVYIDPLQKNRHKGAYSFFDYKVIIDHPKELDEFLCKVPQH